MPRYPINTDVDANTLSLITRSLKPSPEQLIEDRQQRRQQWGSTLKREGIAELAVPDVATPDYVVMAPEWGKRTLKFTGTLSATRTIRLPQVPTAWWYVLNYTNQSLRFLMDPNGTEGVLVGPRQTAAVLTPDGIMLNRVTSNVEALYNVKTLTDGVQTDLFKVQFASGDMKGVAGRVELFMRASSSNPPPGQIALGVRTIYFVGLHHPLGIGSSFGRWGEPTIPAGAILGDAVSSFGGVTIVLSCNGTAHPTFAAPVSDAFTYQVTATSGSMGSPVTIEVQYAVFPQGDLAVFII